MAVNLSRHERVGRRGRVYACFWMAGDTVSGDWWCTTVQAGGFYHFQLNKDVNKGRERVKRMQRECSPNLGLICSRDQIRYWEYFKQGSPRCCFAPHVSICIYAFGKASSMYLACIKECHAISWATHSLQIVSFGCVKWDCISYVAGKEYMKSKFKCVCSYLAKFINSLHFWNAMLALLT